mgnify:CR=1 FL=1
MHYSVVLNISWSLLVSFFFFYPQNLPLEKQFPHTVRSAQQTWDSGLQCTEEQKSAECHLAADHCVISRQAKMHYIHKNSAGYIVSCGNQSIYRIPTLSNSVIFVSCFVTLVKASTSDIVFRTKPKRSVTMGNITIRLQFMSV